jgi:hypothetical protein
MRAAAKEERQLKQQQKAAEKEEQRIARAAQKQLRDDLKSLKQGSLKSLKASQASETIVVDDEEPVDEVVPIISTSSRGRNINLPKRFR